jgi:hypothetical protein
MTSFGLGIILVALETQCAFTIFSSLSGLNLVRMIIGIVLLNETNVEWHRWEHRKNAQKLPHNTFGGEWVELSTSKSKFESSYKPGGTLSLCISRTMGE